MNLQENIHRIKEMMGFINEGDISHKVRKMIDELGIYVTIKMAAGTDVIIPYLTDDDKINYIEEKVASLADEFGGSGFGLVEIDEEPIFYSRRGDEISQIEYLSIKKVIVDVYGGYKAESHLGEFGVMYSNLSSDILDKIFILLVNK